jgi:hypothetical protein
MSDREQTPSAFRARGRSEATLLVRPRPRSTAYVVYGDALGAPEVHIHARVAEDLCSATLRAIPGETSGVLLGRPCRDDYGTYVVVEHTVTAQAGEHAGGRDGIAITADGLVSIRRRAARRHPTLEPVGGGCSLSRGRPRYSPYDGAEPATNPGGDDVAIVVAAEHVKAGTPDGDGGFDALGVYVGCEATLLARRSGECDADPAAPAGVQAAEPRIGSQRSAARAGDIVGRPRIDTPVLIGVAVVAAGFVVERYRRRRTGGGVRVVPATRVQAHPRGVARSGSPVANAP